MSRRNGASFDSDTDSDTPSRKVLASTSSSEPQDGVAVSKIPPRPNTPSRPLVTTGKPKRLSRVASMRMAYGGGGAYGGNTVDASAGNFYSPELSTDFLQLPQSRAEQWAYYRFFFDKNPFVHQAVSLHTELPLSRVRLNTPKAQNREIALAATRFCETWARKVGLLRRLGSIVHELNLIGLAVIMAEDRNAEMPEELLLERVPTIREDADGEPVCDRDGNPIIDIIERPVQDTSKAVAWLKKNYQGWTSVRCLPPEQVMIESFNFTDAKLVELVPDSKTKKIIQQADSGDPRAQSIVKTMAADIVDAVRNGTNIPLGTDPDAGSFVYIMENKKSDYAEGGTSILGCCLQTLVHWDILRQANASIASRHMTPHRVVWALDMSAADVEALREQVDLSLQDPDFSIVSNFEIQWNEMGTEQRLLDLTSEMEITNRELYAGLGVTEGLLTGESSYSGDRISLEIINTRYMLLRELLQDFVEDYLFKPMCRRMGFIEEDEDGNEVVIYPKLSFTRLALRDSQDTFEILMNLYNKGSLDIDVILELLNIDPVSTREKIERDAFTNQDPNFNEVMRGIYVEAGRVLADPNQSDAVQKIADSLGVRFTKPKAEGRFG